MRRDAVKRKIPGKSISDTFEWTDFSGPCMGEDGPLEETSWVVSLTYYVLCTEQDCRKHFLSGTNPKTESEALAKYLPCAFDPRSASAGVS